MLSSTSKLARRAACCVTARRCMATVESSSSAGGTMAGMMDMMGMGSKRKERKEGDIGSVFASLSGEAEVELPERFLTLKRSIIGDEANQARLKASWKTLTARLAELSSTIPKQQQSAIPVTSFEDFVNPSQSLIDEIKRCGTVIVQNVVSEEQALKWLEEIKAYVKLNPEVKGFPADDKQVFELYWSKPQLEARSHLRSLEVQRRLMNLFSAPPSAPVSLLSPLTYADRLRIRNPGDAKFALGPHMDGGSVERWEDAHYREVYRDILNGNWENFNPWEIEQRSLANQNMYDGPGSCGVFRAFQGWTSLSHTGPNEGTLRVYPHLREMSAYLLLRPLFRETASQVEVGTEAYLAPDNWVIDTETTKFPGAPMGRSQELNDETHPHLQLSQTMVSIPKVAPGDQAWWHADMIHAVESVHQGKGPSAVMYIPSVPMTSTNLGYVRDQRESFKARRPPPDFPGGVGESSFKGTGADRDIVGEQGRTGMGLAPFALDGDLTSGERAVREQANSVFGFA